MLIRKIKICEVKVKINGKIKKEELHHNSNILS